MNNHGPIFTSRHRRWIDVALFRQRIGLPQSGPPMKRVGQDFSKISIYAREAALIVDEEGQKVFEAIIAEHGCHPRLLELQKEIFGHYLVSPPPKPFPIEV